MTKINWKVETEKYFDKFNGQGKLRIVTHLD
jgi:hypothetical protein